MDAREIVFGRNAAGRQEATLDFVVVALDEKGKMLHQVNRGIRLDLDDAQYGQVLKSGITMTANAEVPLNSARIRVVVHDVGAGFLGSVDLPLK
jgi:hypothetical protein